MGLHDWLITSKQTEPDLELKKHQISQTKVSFILASNTKPNSRRKKIKTTPTSKNSECSNTRELTFHQYLDGRFC